MKRTEMRRTRTVVFESDPAPLHEFSLGDLWGKQLSYELMSKPCNPSEDPEMWYVSPLINFTIDNHGKVCITGATVTEIRLLVHVLEPIEPSGQDQVTITSPLITQRHPHPDRAGHP